MRKQTAVPFEPCGHCLNGIVHRTEGSGLDYKSWIEECECLKEWKRKMPRKKKRRRGAGEGTFYSFHGAFTNKEKAEAKAKKARGFVISRVPRGQNKRRYIVLGEKVPF